MSRKIHKNVSDYGYKFCLYQHKILIHLQCWRSLEMDYKTNKNINNTHTVIKHNTCQYRSHHDDLCSIQLVPIKTWTHGHTHTHTHTLTHTHTHSHTNTHTHKTHTHTHTHTHTLTHTFTHTHTIPELVILIMLTLRRPSLIALLNARAILILPS